MSDSCTYEQPVFNLRNLIGHGYDGFWNTKCRYAVVKGSRGSKKSFTIAYWIIINMMAYPLANTLVVRKVADTNRDSTFALLKKVIYTLGVQDSWIIKESPMEMIYIGNSTGSTAQKRREGQKILFRGLDDPQKLSSIGVTKGVLCWAWFEEAYQINRESDFDMVDQSIRGVMPEGSGLWKRIMVSFNPWNKGHWLRCKFFENEDGTPLKDDSIYAITTNYMCNEWLDEEDLKFYQRMKERNPRMYEVAGLGNWGNPEGLIYEDWEEKEFDYHEIAMKEGIQASYGLDFGFADDPCAFVAILADVKNYTIWVWDELYEYHLTNTKLAQRLKDKGYARADIIADSEAPKDIAELMENGMRSVRGCYKFHGSILNGIQRLQDYHIIIHPRCVNLLTEIANYAWLVDRNGITQNKPAPGMDHACLVGGTMITSKTGDVPIENIKAGMSVLTRKGYKTVLASDMTGHERVYKLTLENGMYLIGTSNHPIHTTNGFVPLGEIKQGTPITVKDGVSRSKSLEDTGKTADVYNLKVEGEHEYYANGIVTHNCDALRYSAEGLDMGRGGGYLGNVDEDTAQRYANDTDNVPTNRGYINGERPMYTQRHYDEDDPEPEIPVEEGHYTCFST